MSEPEEQAWVVGPVARGTRLDRWLADRADISKREAAQWCEAGAVVDQAGRRGSKGDVVREGQTYRVRAPTKWFRAPAAASLTILAEFPELLVVDKPAGQHCHPLRRGEGGTTLDALGAKFPEVWEAFDVPREGGLGHRLDQGTSGVLLVARTAEAHAALRRAFTEHRCEKTYEALVAGRVPAKGLHIDAPIAHDPADATRMVVGAGRGQPRNAQSRVRTLRSSSEASWVCLQTSTGARHQVRVHLASRGHPLVGDALYGGPASLLGHPWLHARSVRLPEDLTRAWGLAEASFQAPVPGPFVEAAAALGLPPTGGHSG